MSDSFQFKSNTVSMTLCNRQYTLTVDEDTVRICDRIRTEAKEYLLRLNSENQDTDATISEICKFFEACIDRLIGSGETAEIFGARPIKLLDLTDLLSFILSKIGKSVVGRVSRQPIGIEEAV